MLNESVLSAGSLSSLMLYREIGFGVWMCIGTTGGRGGGGGSTAYIDWLPPNAVFGLTGDGTRCGQLAVCVLHHVMSRLITPEQNPPRRHR